MNVTVVFAILSCLLFAVPGHADYQDSREQLQQIRKRIEQKAGDLEQQESAEKNLLRDLSVVATSIKQIDGKIESIRQKEKENTKNLKNAQLELQNAQKQIENISRNVNKRLVALYKEGETGPLKLFFSSDSPMELVQQYQYLGRILDHDRQLLDEFRNMLTKQREKQVHLEQLQDEQKRLLDDANQKREEVAQARVLYKDVLRRVRKDKKQLTQELIQLEARAQRLEKLLKQLESENKSKSSPAPQQSKFSALKGRLPWPLRGSVVVGFGTQHNKVLGSVLESHGIEISYNTSLPVKAVASGRIVFASWFKGYGNLMIIDHANGYHTLYSQAERLEGNIGDIVHSGDVIAQTGPQNGQGIYFEIRQNGAPVDPLLWLSSK